MVKNKSVILYIYEILLLVGIKPINYKKIYKKYKKTKQKLSLKIGKFEEKKIKEKGKK